MRAATAIVGAIAAASILIALAFILSGGGGSGGEVVTRTVVKKVEAPEPASAVEEPGPQEAGIPQFGGPTNCNGGEFGVENVSCEVGEQIIEGYEEGGRGELFAEDNQAGETITMTCGGAAPVECKGPGGAKVYFGE
jgi:hypothetical protein